MEMGLRAFTSTYLQSLQAPKHENFLAPITNFVLFNGYVAPLMLKRLTLDSGYKEIPVNLIIQYLSLEVVGKVCNCAILFFCVGSFRFLIRGEASLCYFLRPVVNIMIQQATK
jgi:hypothetical protein